MRLKESNNLTFCYSDFLNLYFIQPSCCLKSAKSCVFSHTVFEFHMTLPKDKKVRERTESMTKNS